MCLCSECKAVATHCSPKIMVKRKYKVSLVVSSVSIRFKRVSSSQVLIIKCPLLTDHQHV